MHKKVFTQGFLDIALLTSNASQLRYVLEEGKKGSVFYKSSVILISISLSFQILVGIALLMRVALEKIKKKKLKKQALDTTNKSCRHEDEFEWIEFFDSFISIGILLILIINVFIAAFGVSVGYHTDNNHLQFTLNNETYLAYNDIFANASYSVTKINKLG